MGQKASVTSMLKARWSSRCLQQEGERLASGSGKARRAAAGAGAAPVVRRRDELCVPPLRQREGSRRRVEEEDA